MSSSSSPLCPKVQSNLESFLHSITPSVPCRPLSTDLQVVDNKENVEICFLLGNLWQVYDEWSAYGVGVPMMLSNGETITQYYTPYLSSIQLYTNRKKIGTNDEVTSDDLSDRDELSSFSSDSSSKTWGIASMNSSIAHDSSWQVREWDSLASPYFQYNDTVSPHWRIPFGDKIAELAETLPELISLKSTELSPASWMVVAWSPIYHITSKGRVEGLSTHFLTFHTLSSHSQDTQGSNDFSQAKSKCTSHRNISLPPFGLSTLNMKGDVWINQNTGDYEKLIDLHRAADSWLKQLRVHHHDFDYYKKKNQEVGGVFKCLG